MCRYCSNSDGHDPYYAGPHYGGTDHEERWPSAAALEAIDRRYYDAEWRKYLRGEISDRPDGPDGE
jgi:hypothetical protein